MRKLFTLAAAVLASVGMWAAYAPTADEVIILKDVYDANVTDAGYSTHAAIAWGGTVSFSDKKAGDPNNNGEATSSNVKTCSVKGNGSGKNLTVSFEGCSQIIVYHEKQSSRYVELRAGSKTGDLLGKSVGNTYFTAVDLNANNSYSIFLHGVNNDGGDQDLYIYAVKLIKGETCTNPEFTVSPTEGTGFVDDPIDITVSTKNQSKPVNYAVTVDGEKGVYGTDYSFNVSPGLVQATPLKAGTFEITFSQASNGTYCDAKETVTFVISEKTPVTAVTIDGPTAGYVGQEFVYTATAEGATSYQWLVDGVDANTNAAEFTYTGVKGDHSIVCKARNNFNETDTWIASDPISLKVSSLFGELIKATLKGGTNADMSGIIGGTFDTNLSSGKYKIDKGKYAGVKLSNGNFQEGDTVVITMTAAGGNYPCLFADKDRTTCLFMATEGSSELEYKIVLPAAANNTNTVYLSRGDDTDGYKWNPTVATISVVRPMPAKSTVETLTAVTINDLAIEASDLAELLSAKTLILEDKYVNAPIVKFTKHVVTTYEDDSQKEIDEVIEVTSQQATASTWGASAKIGGNAYTVYTVKQLSYVVTYKDGEATLGTENVAQNGTPAEYTKYQSKQLSSFVAWYSDAALENAVTIGEAVITKDTTFYAKFENAYATSVNFEKIILENGKSYDIMAALGNQNYASNIEINANNALDSLADKENRNYDYLGFKVKESGKLLNFRVANGQTVLVKFGALKMTPQVSINGAAYAAMTITDNVYSYTATGEDLISIYINEANKAVVFKQIIIGETPALEFVMGTIAVAATENGTLAVASPRDSMALVGETVALTVEPAAGYVVSSVTLDGEAIVADGEGKYSFVMPAKNVEVAATFSVATSIDNTEDAVKAVKVIRNGQLFIEKNGKTYNALGAEVK